MERQSDGTREQQQQPQRQQQPRLQEQQQDLVGPLSACDRPEEQEQQQQLHRVHTARRGGLFLG